VSLCECVCACVCVCVCVDSEECPFKFFLRSDVIVVGKVAGLSHCPQRVTSQSFSCRRKVPSKKKMGAPSSAQFPMSWAFFSEHPGPGTTLDSVP
jgi:hypothetical protein